MRKALELSMIQKHLSSKGYVTGGVIQFHSEKNHFRVIKMFGRESGLLIDGDRE